MRQNLSIFVIFSLVFTVTSQEDTGSNFESTKDDLVCFSKSKIASKLLYKLLIHELNLHSYLKLMYDRTKFGHLDEKTQVKFLETVYCHEFCDQNPTHIDKFCSKLSPELEIYLEKYQKYFKILKKILEILEREGAEIFKNLEADFSQLDSYMHRILTVHAEEFKQVFELFLMEFSRNEVKMGGLVGKFKGKGGNLKKSKKFDLESVKSCLFIDDFDDFGNFATGFCLFL